MAGLTEPETIDVVATKPDGRVLLALVEDRPWGADPDQAKQLKTKLTNYGDYILGGQLAAGYPEADTRQVTVLLRCVTMPPPEILEVIDAAIEGFGSYGIAFTVQIAD